MPPFSHELVITRASGREEREGFYSWKAAARAMHEEASEHPRRTYRIEARTAW